MILNINIEKIYFQYVRFNNLIVIVQTEQNYNCINLNLVCL